MDVFVYGTLEDPDRADRVLSEYEYRGSALLDGLHRVDGTYPTIAPGGRVEGRILSTPDVESLDAYEGVDRGLYVRESVPTGDGSGVAVYVGDPDSLELGDVVRWPGEGPFGERVRRYLRHRNVRVRRL